MSVLKIFHPSPAHDDRTKPLPRTFIAVGIVPTKIQDADGNLNSVQSVTGFVHLCPGANQEEEPIVVGKTLRLCPTKRPGFLRWVILFKTSLSELHRVRLTVQAFGKGQPRPLAKESVKFWAGPVSHFLPTFLWPAENNYELDPGELPAFICCGDTDHAITSVTLGTTNADYFDWSSQDETWWGEFDNLSNAGPNPLTLELKVTSTEGTNNTPQYVIIPVN
ncbi:MAG: hypothetical protein U0792_04420 [Gemmataceae bacterium]